MQQKRRTESQKIGESEDGTGDLLLCGIVLAGGEGKRLRPFVHLLRQDLLPKQYVNFIGTRSMLEHTFHRAEKLIPPQRVFAVINQSHLQFSEAKAQVSRRLSDTMIVQPENKETAPGLLLPLMHIAKRYPESAVVVLPSDQFVLEEDELMRQVHLAYLLVRQDPSRLVLLGIKPEREESEYGYILPGKKINGGPSSEISCFVEKPDLQTARNLVRAGALWNTMIMVFRTATLLELVSQAAPTLYSLFHRLYQVMGTDLEDRVLRDIYQGLPPLNFSKEILEPLAQSHPSRLLTVPVRNVLWSDWGTEGRIMDVLRMTGYMPRLTGLFRAPYRQLMTESDPERSKEMPGRRQITPNKKITTGPKAHIARAVTRSRSVGLNE
jgi:mannose-1-phosphate guanylyltransferase